MYKIIRLSIANIKKHKKESILLGLLVVFSMALIASSLSSILGIKRITPDMAEKSGCFKNFIQIKQDDYTDRFLSFFEDNPSVEKYDHAGVASGMLKVKNLAGKGEDKQYDISFVSESKEASLESFEVESSLSGEEIAELEHPVYLDSSNKKALGVSTGDNLTLLYEKKAFTFTVAGFYESGLWILGTKAVVSEEDFADLEEYLERYEVIGINTAKGTDHAEFLKEFETFAKDISVNDLTASLFSYSYEAMETNNTTNMSLLSVIVALMAGVIVIAVIIMIRFRIVSDINEQLVSIGVLEAMGYTSGEITLSYIVEYVLIALAGAVISILPTILLTGFLLDNAASTIHYGGELTIPAAPVVLSMTGNPVFIGLIAMTKALSVRKYPPVLAFRKGIQTHHFKTTFFPLEKTKGNIHIRLAMKGFLQNAGQSVGLTVCITAAAAMVLTSFMIGSFFSNADRILYSVCGHELSDIRIETAGGIDHEDFAKELGAMEEVEKVLMTANDVGISFPESESSASLEVYDDYAATESILLTEGRLPKHDNEIAMTSQMKKRLHVQAGDTISAEYGRVRRDYVVSGFVNSVIDANTAYMTEAGFHKIHPNYHPNAFDIYLKKGEDSEEFSKLLKSRYGNNISDISNGEVTGDTLEERIRSAAEIKMAKAMAESGVSYMEYAVRVGDKVIKGSTGTIKIKSLSYIKEDYKEAAASITTSFAAVAIVLMIVSAVVVMIILSILMASSIRKQYKELGIMKGLGYTSRELKFQMAFKIIPPTVFAVIFGSLISVVLLGLVEMFIAKIAVSVTGILVTDLLILLFCFACAYRAAGKIGKISVYELMTE